MAQCDDRMIWIGNIPPETRIDQLMDALEEHRYEEEPNGQQTVGHHQNEGQQDEAKHPEIRTQIRQKQSHQIDDPSSSF